MAKRNTNIILSDEIITSKIYLIRDKKVMLDHDLAKLYKVETKVLKQAVRRNIKRFPKDLMFELTNQEFSIFNLELFTTGFTENTG